MGFKRRSLLKATGLTLTAWGLESWASEQSWFGSRWLDSLGQSAAVLAAPTGRKLALLVGIDQYSHDDRCPALKGCLNDLELQRQLLIHRFGFQADDILVLQNKQATRAGLQTAFIDHLLRQVSAEDTVFFHFSGYGSTVQASPNAEMQRSLVLHDSCASAKSTHIKDLPEATLLLLLKALPTERIVSVLDTGYRLPEDSPVSDGVRLRTRPSPAPAPFDDQTLQLQDALQQQLKSRGFLPTAAQSPGVVLQATDLMNAALEVEGQIGTVGLLTHALTQQLWNMDAAASWRSVFEGTMTRLAQELSAVQTPRLLDATYPGRSLEKSGLNPRIPRGGAGAVVNARNNNDIDLWLGGLSSVALAYCNDGSVVTVASPQTSGSVAQSEAESTVPIALQIHQRSGLAAQAKLLSPPDGTAHLPSVGSLVQEQVRVIPHRIDLAIAIDQRLDRIERVDATSALTAIPRITVVAMKHDPADYVFGRVLSRKETLVASIPQDLRSGSASSGAGADESSSPNASTKVSAKQAGESLGSDIPADTPAETPLEIPGSEYGLLTLGREVLPATVGASAEAIKTAVQRLQPHLETLRAAKNFQLLENSLTTQLAVQSRWDVAPASSSNVRASSNPTISPKRQFRLLNLSVGDRLRYQIKNESDRPLYTLIVGFDPQGRWKPLVTTHLLEPLAPTNQQQGDVTLGKHTGVTELYTLVSTAAFEQTHDALTDGAASLTAAQADQPVADPYALSDALLQDLHEAGQAETAWSLGNETYALNLKTWAGFCQTCLTA